MKIVMVLTPETQTGDTEDIAAFSPESAAPCYVFHDADLAMTLAWPTGSQASLNSKRPARSALPAANDAVEQQTHIKSGAS